MRKESIRIFRELKTLFEARMSIAKVEASENLETYQTVANELSEIIEQYNDTVLRFTDKKQQKDETVNE